MKRKLKSDYSPILRKSMRIDKINSSHKKIQETVVPQRKAFEAEEKLKKLAEQADLAKKMVSTSSKETNSSKSSQGISEENKKSSVAEGSDTKKKIQLVLQKVKKVQKKGLLNAPKRKLLLVGKKQPLQSTKSLNKVVSTKVGFQRHLKMNQSQRHTNAKVVDIKQKNVKGKVVSVKDNISKLEVARSRSSKSIQEMGASTSKRRSGSDTPKNIVPKTGKFEISF